MKWRPLEWVVAAVVAVALAATVADTVVEKAERIAAAPGATAS
ncbi:hypothetical protein [Phenylobacterium sp.]|jgi:hypothetical protein|nr:hypothetical protein [Phenylobacterium sp.]HEX2558840.1 hypothetical protein [Phenylobacterium sp.]